MSWDQKFMDACKFFASWSKDPSTKVGCVIVGMDREIRSIGYNGFPRGVDDTDMPRYERPAKYLWTEHAERNAVYNAARMGVSLKNCTAYVSSFPCADCARAIIQSGILKLVCPTPDMSNSQWGESWTIAKAMLCEAHVKVTLFD